MIAYGTISEVVRVLGRDAYRITFEIEARPNEAEVQELTGKRLEITAREKKAKRSLDANAYYWALIGKLARKLRTSNNQLHNLMLRSYGQPMLIDDKKAFFVIPDTPEAERKALESETFHIKPTSEVRTDKSGKSWRTYFLLRGSHEYNAAEFSRILDALIEECKAQGIETLPPEEIERMMDCYAKKIEKHNAG